MSSHHGRHHHLRQFIHNPESCLRWSPDGLALAVATFFCETSCQSMVKVGGRRGPSHFWTISKVLTKACVPNCHHSIHGQERRQTQTVNIYKHIYDRSLGPIRGPTSSWRPFGPAWLCPLRPSSAQAVWPTQQCNDGIVHFRFFLFRFFCLRRFYLLFYVCLVVFF